MKLSNNCALRLEELGTRERSAPQSRLGQSNSGQLVRLALTQSCLTDFSQIELRILAHLSGDPELLKLFQESERDDVFSTLTSQW